MVSNVQDSIMLLGDSLTQGGWEPNGFAQRLACEHSSQRIPSNSKTSLDRRIREKIRCYQSWILWLQYRMGYPSLRTGMYVRTPLCIDS